MFFRGSRYANVPEHELTNPRGRVIRYKGIREIPLPVAQRSHIVRQGDRLELVAHEYFREPERFWRICDANRATWPGDLLAETGRRLAIPAAEG